MLFHTDKVWHRGDAAKAVAPMADVRGLGIPCPSVPGVCIAPRGFAAAPTLVGQTTP